MAKPRNLLSEAFWSKDPSDEEQSVVVVPGLLMEGNVRSETNVKCCQIQEVRAKPTKNTDYIFVNPMKTRPVKLSMSNEVKEKQGSKTASLKDLCPEDKRRIANLIKELARVSEEKEETKERLKAEQESFEKKIKELEHQNNLIVTERETLQQQYKKCQELLTVYQNYLSEQKEKLNQSLRDCNNGKLEVNAKKNSPKTAASNLDGSYLGTVPPGTLNAVNKSKQVLVCPSVAPHLQCDHAHYFPNSNILNHVHPMDNLPLQNGCEMKTETSIHGNPVLVRHCNIKDLQVGASSFSFDTAGDQLSQCGWLKGRTDKGVQFTGGQNRNFIPLMEHNVTTGMFCDAAMNGQIGTMTGEVLHEMKMPADQKQQLLCQKKELELEKETLQRLLAQQEALLLLKQQQLQESVLDYSRSKHNLLEAEDVTYGEVPTTKTRISLLNSAGSTERYLKSGDHLYNASLQKPEGNFKASTEVPWERLNGNKIESFDPELNTFRGTAFSPAGGVNRQQIGITSLPKKDAATSPVPVVKKYQPVNVATSPIWPESLSYEASLVHLVDTLSPVSPQKHNMHIKETYGTPRKSNLTPSGYHQRPVRIRTTPTRSVNSDEELEESRMLEDIFFI